MPREKRLVLAGSPHHITQRGNNRQTVFRSDADRFFYLKTLNRKRREHHLRILGYCLMTNHIHLVAIPGDKRSMALAIGQTHLIYAQRFNFTSGHSGHLWQNRFYSCPLGPTRLVDALVYTDMNPVRAQMVDRAEDHPWSSAASHVHHHDSADLLDLWAWSDLDPNREWADRLAAADSSPRASTALRLAIRRGLPYGDEAFVASLEQRLGRPLRPQKPGPKRTRSQVAAG